MKRFLLILIFLAYAASATVEDLGESSNDMFSVWPTQPESTSLYLPSPCPEPKDSLKVTVGLVGPKASSSEEERDARYVTQGKTLEFLVSVKNEGSSSLQSEICVSSDGCPPEWFDWTVKSLQIPPGGTRSEKLLVTPDMAAVAGRYDFTVDASAKCCKSSSGTGYFYVQDLDYASETAITGTGQFQLDKNVHSMNSGIRSDKKILFSGTVDALVKNEYLVDQSKGKNPTFEELDAVDNYNAILPGDALIGVESFKSSAIFGGVGAKLQQNYDVQQMEFKSQSFNLQTGSDKKTAEFKTADNFTGFYLIDAKQIAPGQKSLKEHEEYLGSFEINRKIIFRNKPTWKTPCSELDCMKSTNSGSKFAEALKAFAESA